jgi:hypothetical protein
MTNTLNNVQNDLQPTLATEDIRVYDDVLPPEAFARLRRHVNGLTFRSVHNTEQRKVWRLGDGNPLVGPSDGPPLFPGDKLSLMVEEDSLGLLYDKIEERTRSAGLVSDFIGFTAQPWIYPEGSGLSPHVDGQRFYEGSYTYYLHADWRVQQGGLLIVFDPETHAKDEADEPVLPWIDGDEEESARLNDPGHGRVILPRPNRLVLLSPRAEHMITTVRGGHPRLSIAGFFYRPDVAQFDVEGKHMTRDEVVEYMRRMHVNEEEQPFRGVTGVYEQSELPDQA